MEVDDCGVSTTTTTVPPVEVGKGDVKVEVAVPVQPVVTVVQE